MCGLPLAQHRRAEDITIECDRALYVSNNEGVSHYKLEAGALIRFGHPLFSITDALPNFPLRYYAMLDPD